MRRQFFIPIFCISSLLLLVSTSTLAQNDPIKKEAQPKFYLYYGYSGIGANLGSFQPTININETSFVYTYEQNSYWGERSKRKDTICVKVFRQSSIDSILEIIKELKDTTIRDFNPCIIGGGIHSLTITNGIDTTRFQLSNTFDYTALKIAKVLNEYVPEDKKLWVNEQMILDSEACWKDRLERWKKNAKRKPARKQKHKNGT